MRTPVSTYRFQITEDFDLHEAAPLVPYLHGSASTGSTCRRCLAAEGVGPRLRRRRTMAASTRPGVGTPGVGPRGRHAPPRDAGAGRHRAQPRRRRESPSVNAVVVDGADPRTVVPLCRGVRHRLGGGCGPGVLPVVGDDDLRDDGSTSSPWRPGSSLPRPRFPLAPGSADGLAEDGDDHVGIDQDVHAHQHYGWCRWRTPTPTRIIAGSSPSMPRRHPCRGPGVVRPLPSTRSSAGSARGSSTGACRPP